VITLLRAIGTVLVVLLLGSMATPIASATAAAPVVEYAYDSAAYDPPTTNTAFERGPPAAHDHITPGAADRRSLGAPARPEALSVATVCAYDHAPLSVQLTGDGVTTQGPAEVNVGNLVVCARSQVAANTVTRGEAGHGSAARVLEGGRADGQTVFAGHGTYRWGAGDTVVPEGTTVHVYAGFDETIGDALGQAIETGGAVTPTHVFGPGPSIPNYVLRTPDNLTIYSGSTTVGRSTP
jgi:hypothetical protein